MILRLLTVVSAALASAAPAAIASKIAYHQHLVSPATAKLLGIQRYDGSALLRDLDRAHIGRGVVLSMGYTYADDRKQVPEPDAAVRAENDWTAGQIAQTRGRLTGFCSVNPLRSAAADEISRCTRLSGMHGLKLHFGNSGVSLRTPASAVALRGIFALADELRLPIVVHLRARTGTAYGAEDARLFLNLLAAAPHVPVQVAHLGGGGLFEADTRQVMGVFIAAIRAGDPRTRHLVFDLTSAIMPESTAEDGKRVAAAIRGAGLKRILFGTDLPVGGNPAPAEAWRLLLAKVPLRPAEWRVIATNHAEYLPVSPRR